MEINKFNMCYNEPLSLKTISNKILRSIIIIVISLTNFNKGKCETVLAIKLR